MAPLVRRYGAHALTSVVAGALVLAPGAAGDGLVAATQSFLAHMGWLVILASTAAILVCAAVALSPLGRTRLGGPNAQPEFSRIAWLMMLFAAGMGAGLVFWGVAEPLIHTLTPKPGGAPDADPTRRAMAIVMLHWALHPWAIYAIGALAVGYFGFDRSARNGSAGGAPAHAHLRPSTALGVTGPAAATIDQIALFAVVFGIVASLGQGVIQIAAGLGAGVDGGAGVGLAVLGVLFACYALSAATGLRRGVKWLSEFNLVLAAVLMAFVFVVGATGAALRTTFLALVDYVVQLPNMAVDLGAGPEGRQWAKDWTLTYFLWWVAWIPFVGMFIARISYGRSVRELVAGVLLAPSLFSLAWFGVLGGAALDAQLAGGADLGVSDLASAPQATFALLGVYPFAPITQAAALALVFIFLVTSADSGAYVLAMLSDQGEARPPIAERLFWGAAMAALTAAALLTGGGQTMMRALAVAGGVPMLFLMIPMGARLLREAWRRRRTA